MERELSKRSGEDGLNTSSLADETPVGGAQSEVARLLTQISAEYEAALNGLNGLAQGVSQHAFIHARYTRMGELHKELGEVVGDQEAMTLLVNHLDNHQEQGTP